MTLDTWISILLIVLVGLGIILPVLIRQKVVTDTVFSRYSSLITLILVSAVTAFTAHWLAGSDVGTIFTRAFLVDGISIYVLLNAPMHKDDKTND